MQFGEGGGGNGQFSVPTDVAVDAEGNIYVVDQGNNRIQMFSSSGTYLTQWGSIGDDDGQFTLPTRIAIDLEDNSIYVTDTGNDRVQKFQ